MDRAFAQGQNIAVMDVENAAVHGLERSASIEHFDSHFDPGPRCGGRRSSGGAPTLAVVPARRTWLTEQRQRMDGVRGLDTPTPAGRDTMSTVDNFHAQGTPYGKPYTLKSGSGGAGPAAVHPAMKRRSLPFDGVGVDLAHAISVIISRNCDESLASRSWQKIAR